MRFFRNSKAFTLIELLIVVAIIAILAAIAVPNFLEAQVRSKVSRTHADMRSVATALECYAVDNNKYPPRLWDTPNWTMSIDALQRLTTPVGCITSLPFDVFSQAPRDYATGYWQDMGYFVYYDRLSANIHGEAVGWGANYFDWSHGPALEDGAISGSQWVLKGYGPDRMTNWDQIDSGMVADSYGQQKLVYDTTNGTSSWGDIWRWGP